MAALALFLVLYLPALYFVLLTTAITLWLAWEWSSFLGLRSSRLRGVYVLIVALALLASFRFPIWPVLIVSVVFWLWATFVVVTYPKTAGFCCGHWLMRGVVGILALIPCWLSINVIHAAVDGPLALVLLVVFVSMADTGAYFTGRFWGRRPLLPNVSPKKTWEGVFGGVLGAFLVVIIASIVMDLDFQHWLLMMALALVVVSFSVVGDLLESVLKRQAGVKDSGNLLPGHGGLLDRIDSLLAAAPLFLFACLLGKHLGL